MSGLLLGIDIGGTKTAYALARSGSLELIAAYRRVTNPSAEPERDVQRMAADARALLAGVGATPGDLVAVGISAPGPVDPERGLLIDPPNLDGWGEVPIRSLFAAELPAPIWVENDANAAALAEWRFGAGRGFANLVYLTMSTGVGAGLILEGRLHRGKRGLAGELGHSPVEWEGEPCTCGLRGCLEAYVGGAAWSRRLRGHAPADSLVVQLAAAEGGAGAPPKPEQVVAAARAGDAFALSEFARFNDYLARGIVQLSFALAPEAVVLGTIAAAAGEALCLAPVREQVAAHLWPSFNAGLQIVAASLGEQLPYRAGLGVALAGLEEGA